MTAKYHGNISRPDMDYKVHQCARFRSNQKSPPNLAILRIGRYPMKTIYKGISFKR